MHEPIPPDALRPGYRFSVRRVVEPGEVRRSVEYARDRGGYHVDEAFAHAAGFRTVIASGVLHHALIAEVAGRIHLLGREMHTRLQGPIYDGDVLETTAEVAELISERRQITLAIEIVNQHGATLATCRLNGYLPDPAWGTPGEGDR